METINTTQTKGIETMTTKKAFKTVKEKQIEIANAVIAQMQTAGTGWLKSWQGMAGTSPTSMATGKAYQGINWLILNMKRTEKGFSSHHWATFNQWLKLGYQVQRKEDVGGATTVVIYKKNLIKDKKTGEKKWVPFFNTFPVFNGDQVKDDNGQAYQTEPRAELITDPTLADKFANDCGAIVQHDDLNRAFYVPSLDYINMPTVGQFDSPEAYQATLMHELTHWTGNKTRLDRFYKNADQTKDYALEELVAELGAAMLCGSLGISATPREDHAKYLNGWIKRLKDEPGAIFKAAAAASKATDYLLDISQEYNQRAA